MSYKKSLNYTMPVVKDRGGDLTKNWFVSYSFRNPNTGKMERKQVYSDINSFSTKTKRTKAANALKKAYENLLQNGYSPFEKFEVDHAQKEELGISIDIIAALDEIIKVKQQHLAETSYKSTFYRYRIFKDWLIQSKLDSKQPAEITRQNILDFLTYLGQRVDKKNKPVPFSARSRNNYLLDISSFWSKFVEYDYCQMNICDYIKPIKTKSRVNKSYKEDQLHEIVEYIKKEDQQLYLFIKFVSYTFLRPQEVIRIQLKNLDLEEKTVTVDTKTDQDKIKLLSDDIVEDLTEMHLKQYEATDYLFTPEQKPGPWQAENINKRDYFTKRFKKVVKDHFNLGREYGLYSFRHTFITDLYNSYRKKGLSAHETKNKLMGITGHSTFKGLENYLRGIQAEKPQDYSQDFTLKI